MTVASRVSSAVRTHKTHAERSAETRTLLLDASVESLIEVGYAAMSTTDVVRRAGVSRGAQVHHFPRKVELVQAAVRHLALKVRHRLLGALAELPDDGSRADVALQLLWDAYEGPFFWAAVELVVAGRTDDALRPALDELQETIEETVHEFCIHLFGPDAGDESSQLRSMVDLSTQFMNGLALVKQRKGDAWCRQQIKLWSVAMRPFVDGPPPDLQPPS